MTSQTSLLAAYFKARPFQWLPMPELAQVITETGIGAAVHSRVADCRKLGMDIEQRGNKKSEYRFLPSFPAEMTAQQLEALL